VSSSTYFTTLKDPSDMSDFFFTVIGDWGACPESVWLTCGSQSAEHALANLQDAAADEHAPHSRRSRFPAFMTRRVPRTARPLWGP
jgi:hypothetical protein